MYQLHPYQMKLVEQAREELKKGNKSCLLVSPAGSGKSVVIAEIARLTTLKGGRVMFMVHRQELINQIIGSFKANSVDLNLCTVMTVGKIRNRLDKLPRPNLIITDETHHSLAKTYRDIYDYYANVPRLGFSATPWRLNGKGLGDVYDAMIEGPDVQWLIDNHYLAPFDYYSVNLIDESKLSKSSTGDYSNKSIDEAVGHTIYGDVIKTYRDKVDGQQAIVYAHSIVFSKQIAQQFRDAGINAAHCDSKTPQRERDKIMTDFKKGTLKVLSNCDLISEGYNVPDCSCVIMLRPTESLVLFIQQSMRCMRFKPGKQATIIDHVANYTRFGLPNTPHKWTLKDREKKKKSTNTTVDTPIKQCAFCFAVIPAQSKNCPLCGHEVEVVQTEIKVDETARIEKIESNFRLQADYIVTKKISELKSYEELKAYAKARGYKQGWIYFQAKNKGLIKGAK
ncbi:DEAD/DEAH box helicase [Latilactobacillus curvatus]|uniref:DEAD/DEAH box helicase n=1 Tax=Latilactobacillus curvatus TaxID=28038 RepID=UPI0021A8D4F1|nr:DEAD/DEAH box helicase [Latilactobacillus curvatus]MCT3532269.1 DEAD/DEAH box helicase [Latilactobacillus curvatus]